MRREYKGFLIEECPADKQQPYRIFHTVTGNLAGSERTIADCKDRINEIHSSAYEYSRYAGCQAHQVEKYRNRYRYSRELFK